MNFCIVDYKHSKSSIDLMQGTFHGGITEASSEVGLNKNVVTDTVEPVESCVNSSLGFLQDSSDMKTGFESFIPKEALRVQ